MKSLRHTKTVLLPCVLLLCVLLLCVLLLCVLVLLSVAPLLADEVRESAKPRLPKDTLPKQLDIEAARRRLEPLELVPADNPLTEDRVTLGRRLFFDGILSKDGTVSCASCHQPNHGFASADPQAIGIRGQIGKRNAPTVINRGLGQLQFWDGRAASLEQQALQPIGNSAEMDHSVEGVIAALQRDPTYVKQFEQAFAEPDDEAETRSATKYVNSANLAKSLAGFQRTLLSVDSPVDEFQGGDYNALSIDERQGLWIFESRGRCWKCHTGDNYTDEAFHNTGIGFERKERDLGRYEVTKLDADRAKFKTPTLRAISRTAPYMHDGSLKTLADVVEFYNLGGAADDPGIDREMKPLGLSGKEVDQLVAFLKALTESR